MTDIFPPFSPCVLCSSSQLSLLFFLLFFPLRTQDTKVFRMDADGCHGFFLPSFFFFPPNSGHGVRESVASCPSFFSSFLARLRRALWRPHASGLPELVSNFFPSLPFAQSRLKRTLAAAAHTFFFFPARTSRNIVSHAQ